MVVPLAGSPPASPRGEGAAARPPFRPALHAALGTGRAVPAESWLVLAVWAVGAPLAAAATFRFEYSAVRDQAMLPAAPAAAVLSAPVVDPGDRAVGVHEHGVGECP